MITGSFGLPNGSRPGNTVWYRSAGESWLWVVSQDGGHRLQPEWVQVYTLCRVLIYMYSRVLGYGHSYVLLH
jgi:hypothetical protein